MIRNNVKWIVGIIIFAMVAPFFFKFCAQDVDESTVLLPPPVKEVKYPEVNARFNENNAYALTEKLLTFGQRHFDTKGHEAVRQWLVSELKTRGATVTEQAFKAKTPTGKETNCTNIFASYNPEKQNRILFGVHWDSRHIADRDTNVKNQTQPILGADDSGTGIGILLELANLIQQDSSKFGVDIVFFDAEDWGKSGDNEKEDLWCQGSKYWATHLPSPNYKPQYAILLDMVGARNARFPKEAFSMKYASNTVEKVWKTARQLGYMDLFVDEMSSNEVIDDHKAVNQLAKIPMIDIINYPADRFLGEHHHTAMDNGMSHIDKNTMRAVGQTIWHLLHYENAGVFQ
jgi:glutaminyl-peptide cyclotransferase